MINILQDFLNEARRGEITAGAIVLVRHTATICAAISKLPTAAAITPSPCTQPSETRHHRRDGQLTPVTTLSKRIGICILKIWTEIKELHRNAFASGSPLCYCQFPGVCERLSKLQYAL